ncbi:MAG: NADP-dependent glyceraldehyde-3-phosphate dehydrogenase [Thaumarchaeota archaeon]|jgi:glyceraldehyde-3-phosphate dehydrogenase [NAD(P)+]|nr:NADP-dependent glyceraldehyde-3-phosphate dehydrogenase [Candidatus Wolframiiraptor allenii]
MNALRLRSPVFSGIYHESDDVYEFAAFIAGKWIWKDEMIEVKSPIDLSVIGKVPRLGWEDIDHALDVAYSIGRWRIRDTPGWRRLEILERLASLMEEYRDDLVESLIINSGKTRGQAMGEVNASIDRLRRADLDARKIYGEYMPGDWDPTTLETEAVVRREPLGVVLAIIPFNYPLFDAVSKFTYSVVAGNAVVIKPPSADPIPILLFAKLVEEAGFPKEAFSVLTIPGKESNRLVSDWRIQAISFTGSSGTGRKVIQAAGIKQFIMELGGGDPAIILPDADLDFAAERVAAGIYSYAGQRCDAIKLVLVAEEAYREFRDRLVSQLSRVVVGDPRDEKTSMGPLISPESADEMMSSVEEAVKAGGRILYGGRRLGETYVEPTLIEMLDKNVLRSLRLYKEEVFAPVALITSFSNLDEAIELANGRSYGLDAAIFGHDIDQVRRLARFLEFGAIYINDMPRHGVGYYPFGGRKDSGIGREGVGYSIEYVTAYKTIIYNYREKGVWRYLAD